MGPILWNVMCIEVLMLSPLQEATNVGFVDNLAVVVATNRPAHVEIHAKETVRTVKTWLIAARLTLRARKLTRS